MSRELCEPNELAERIRYVGKRSRADTVESLCDDVLFALKHRDAEIERLRRSVSELRGNASAEYARRRAGF